MILERGKVVRERTKDTLGLWRKRAQSRINVQFGEGGAGTFSDGKLYSQIKDPQHLRPQGADRVRQGRVRRKRSSTSAKPHIGTFRLVTMVENMRATDRVAGRRDTASRAASTTVIEMRRRAGCAAWCWRTASISRRITSCSPSATARATPSRCCTTRGVYIEPKPFSIGFRIEHPQSLIDRAASAQTPATRCSARPTTGWCTTAANGRSVYSFCMCPGGTVVAADVRAGPRRDQWHEPVLARRAQRQCRHRRRHHAGGLSRRRPLAGIEFQRHWEARAFEAGGSELPGARRSWSATSSPGSRRPSSATWCRPTRPASRRRDLARCLPDYAIEAIREALPGVRQADPRLRAARRGADRRRDAHLLADPHHARRRLAEPQHARALSRPARARAMPAASCRPAVDGIKVAEAVALSMAGKSKLTGYQPVGSSCPPC